MNIRTFVTSRFGLVLLLFSLNAHALGVRPETTVVSLSEGEGQSQIVVQNTENRPMLVHVVVSTPPGEFEDLAVFALPAVFRIEAGGRQVVRFAMDKAALPLTRQHLKRVSFEAVPPKNPVSATSEPKSKVTFNITQDIPMLVSPKWLERNDQPWSQLTVGVENGSVKLSNPSPYVVRMQSFVDLPESNQRVQVLENTYLLPGQTVSKTLPKAVSPAPTRIRIHPASPWGYAVNPVDIDLKTGQQSPAATDATVKPAP